MSEDRTSVLEEPDDDEEYDDDYRGPGRTIVIAAVVAIALGAVGYFAGHASAGSGPSTLAQAVQQAQAGKLACGDTGGGAAPAQAGGGGAAPAQAGGAGAAPAGGPGGGGAQFLVRAICQNGGQRGAQGGPAGAGGRFGGGFGAVVGQVQSISGDTLTLQGRQGTVKVKFSAVTSVRKTTGGALSDLKPGVTVSVAGTGQNNQNPADSITVVPSTQ